MHKQVSNIRYDSLLSIYKDPNTVSHHGHININKEKHMFNVQT